MFICEDCGRHYEDDIAYREDYYCPKCCGALQEAKECEVCREYHIEDDLISGVCERCIDKCRHDLKTCLVVGEENKNEVKLNSFLLAIFDERDIEAILIEYLKKRNPDVDCSPFIDNDISWFAEKLTA